MKTLNTQQCNEVNGGCGAEFIGLSFEVVSLGVTILSQIGKHVVPAVFSVLSDVLESNGTQHKSKKHKHH